jgi:hypothetical protein
MTEQKQKPGWPATRYRRRTYIPMFHGEQPVGSLIWRGDGMDVYAADGTPIGKYQTRHQAASALWRTCRARKPVSPETLPGYLGPASDAGHAEREQRGGDRQW